MSESYVYNELNKSWKNTCKVILGEQIGELKEYEKILLENVDEFVGKTSSISKKEVAISSQDYSKGSKFMSFDEVNFEKKYDPIDLNKIRDLDSIINEVQDRIYYTGNVVLGNSRYIEKSTNILDSWNIYGSNIIDDSKNVAYSSMVRACSNIYGCSFVGISSYMIKCYISSVKSARSFESHYLNNCADIFYSQNLNNCQDCMFSFNLKNKKYCIGNLELPREGYFKLKKKLVAEIAENLKRKKHISLLGMIKNSISRPSGLGAHVAKKEHYDMHPIETEFSKTAKIILGRELKGIENYEEFFSKSAKKTVQAQNCITKEPFFLFGINVLLAYPKDRLIGLNEAEIASSLKLSESELQSFKGISNSIGKIAYFCVEWDTQSKNCISCLIKSNALNSYKSTTTSYSKNTAFCFWARNCENAYGIDTLHIGSFCMNVHNSKNLQRCFECDFCENCTDLYFSHNCENVHDSMFCFNVKNKRNAIGNVEYPKEQYLEAKKKILSKIINEIEKNKSLRFSIFKLKPAKK